MGSWKKGNEFYNIIWIAVEIQGSGIFLIVITLTVMGSCGDRWVSEADPFMCSHL